MEESSEDDEVVELLGEGGIGIFAGSTGSECMRSESDDSDDSWEAGYDEGAERFVLFVTGSSEGSGAILWILLDWRKASVVVKRL
jgi:hypothetical protein